MEGNKQKSSHSSKTSTFSVLVPLFCFGVCTVYFSPFVLLSLPAPPPAHPLLRAHPLPAASLACLAEKCRLSRDW